MNRPSMRKANTAARDEAARRPSDDMVSAGYMESPLRDKRRHLSMLVRSKQEFDAEPAMTPMVDPGSSASATFRPAFFAGTTPKHVYCRALLAAGNLLWIQFRYVGHAPTT